MKPFLLAILLLLLGAGPTCAQNATANIPGVSRADSVAVLRQVFQQARKTEQFSTAFFVFHLGINASHLQAKPSSEFRQPVAIVGTSASTAGLILSITAWVRFNHRHEAAAVHQLELGLPLPHYVQRRYARAWAKQTGK